jgi:hypothetical protein
MTVPGHLNDLTQQIIAAGIEVHRALGPGLFEVVYERAMAIELQERHLAFQRQVEFPAMYKRQVLALSNRPHHRAVSTGRDQTLSRVDPVHTAQILTYLRIADLKLGLLLNFYSPRLTDGIRRFVT